MPLNPLLPPYKVFHSTTGMVPVSGDELDDITDPNVLMLYIPTVYEGDTWSDTLTFEVKYAVAGEDVYVATHEVVCTSNGGLSVSITGGSATVSGPWVNAFNEEVFTFVMRDGSIKVLPFDTTEDYKGLIKYDMPSVTSKLKTLSFTVTSINPNTLEEEQTSISVFNWVHWKYESGKTKVQFLTASRA